MATFLSRLGRGAYRRRRWIFAAWIVVLAALIGGGLAFVGLGSTELSAPGSESRQANDVLGREFPAAAGTSVLIVFTAPPGATLTAPQYGAAITASLAAAARAPQVVGVVSPAQSGPTPSTSTQSGLISADQRSVLAEVEYRVRPAHLARGALDALAATVAPAKTAGLTVQLGGGAYDRPVISVGAKEFPAPAPGSPQRVADETIAKAFGPGFTGPLLVLIDLRRTQDDAARQQAVAYARQDLATFDDVAVVSTEQYSKDARYAVFRVIPASAPADPKTAELVAGIRDQAPVFHLKQSIDLQVTGVTAVAVDVSGLLGSAVAPFAALVVGPGLILLLGEFFAVASTRRRRLLSPQGDDQ